MQAKTKRIVRIIAFGIAIVAGLIGALTQLRGGHGLTATYFHNPGDAVPHLTRVEEIALVSSNDNVINPTDPFRIEWDGYIWINRSRDYEFFSPKEIRGRLVIDGRVVFDNLAGTDNGDGYLFQVDNGFHEIRYVLVKTESAREYFFAALDWNTPLGRRHVPASLLYPATLDEKDVIAAQRCAQVHSIALIALFACLLVIGATYISLPGHWWQRRTFWLLLGIVLLAFTLRVLFLRDLALNSPQYRVLPSGSDHRSYVAGAADILRGHWPPPGSFYVQPGITWLIGSLHRVWGTDILALQIVQIVLSSLSVLLCYAINRRTFGSLAAWIAAILWASLPLSIFYDAYPLTHSLEAMFILLIILLWLKSINPYGLVLGGAYAQLEIAAVTGLIIGAAAVLRPSFLSFLPLVVGSIVWKNRQEYRLVLVKASLVLGAAVLPILPVTLHNYNQSGRFQLISGNGPITLYLGNNRDAAGIGEYSQAFLATHELVNRGEASFTGQTMDDILSAPARWVGLMIRKTALYFAAGEIPNNVDFYTEGVAVSTLLATLPFRFGFLSSVGLAGLALMLGNRKAISKGGWIIGVSVLVLSLSTVAFHVVSRFRAPIYGPLTILSGYALALLIQALRDRSIIKVIIVTSTILISAMIVSILPWIAERTLVHPVVRGLPEEASAVNVRLGSDFEIIGYKYSAAVEPGEPTFVNLYTRSESEWDDDIYASVQLFNQSGDKIVQVDQPLGTGSFPDYPTSQWVPGEVVWDQFLLFPPKDIETPIGLDVLVAIYDRESGERFGDAWLAPIALTNRSELELPSQAKAINARIGPALLRGWEYKISAGQLAISLHWQSIEPASAKGVVFLHLFDEGGIFVLGKDTPPLGGAYPLNVWQPGETLADAHQLDISSLGTGEYKILTGIYDPATGERFIVLNADGSEVSERIVNLGNVAIP